MRLFINKVLLKHSLSVATTKQIKTGIIPNKDAPFSKKAKKY